MKSTKKKRHGLGAKSGTDARQTLHPKREARITRAIERQSEEKSRPANDPRRKQVRLVARKQ